MPDIGNAVDLVKQWPKDKNWLILGKGPSFALRDQIDLNSYYIIGLNHVVNICPVDLAHFSDIEALSESANELLKSRCKVILPWHPHKHCQPLRDNLRDLLARTDSLKEFFTKQRLFSYNSTISSHLSKNKDLNTIEVLYFSADAVVSLLAESGIKTIFSLGIDGGKGYSKEFDKKTCLINGRTSFDIQFKAIQEIVTKNKMRFLPVPRKR